MKLSPRDIFQKLLPALVEHRFVILLMVLVAYFLFWPKPTPRISATTSASNRVSQNQSGAGNVSTNTPIAPGSNANSIEEELLYDPASENADAGWSDPAELKAKELQALARQVDQAINDWMKIRRLERRQSSFFFILTDGELKQTIWMKVLSGSFKDAKLSKDWYELVKVRYGAYDRAKVAAEAIQNETIAAVIASRLEGIQVRIIGGNVLSGDVLCLKAVEIYTKNRLGSLSELDPQFVNVTKRLIAEFPSAMREQQRDIKSYFPGEFELPQTNE